ncbi:MAG: YggS family pyridoxal phosphate-dependent enzyme [Chloroflexi bacterium]|nr:YggS family pyridoxal phosphate-dependent enzyme [Chloroflexota bacterium]
METQTIGDRIASVQAEIAQACQRAGRSPKRVTLVAVSKTHSAAEVVSAVEAGLHDFGENRIEEALDKIPGVTNLTDQPIRWHMVGHVQDRKARYVVNDFALLHSLDSVKLAERLNSILAGRERPLDVLLEMNVSGESSKHGWQARRWSSDSDARQTLWDDVRRITELPGLRVSGLMTMAPIVPDPELARPIFVRLRKLRDALANDFPEATWSELSMGMTDDYPVAVEEGATLVRIGRAIFGPRN